MRKTQFSQPINNLITRGTLVLCAFALMAAGAAPKNIITPTTVQAVSPQSVNIPETCTEIGRSSIGAAALTERVWKGRHVLRVRFLDGSDSFRAQVRYYAPLWSKYANIRFDFIERGPSEIRVSFNHKGGSWSYIGNDAEKVDRNEPTMNFGRFNENTTADEFQRTTLHEFGHALGLIHEQQSSRAAINWNKEAVYDFYDKQFGWNRNVVNDNIFEKCKGTQTNTAYDPYSIMHYPIPAEFTLDGNAVGLNKDLSPTDKTFIRKLYR